jgi:hypothetical protein
LFTSGLYGYARNVCQHYRAVSLLAILIHYSIGSLVSILVIISIRKMGGGGYIRVDKSRFRTKDVIKVTKSKTRQNTRKAKR